MVQQAHHERLGNFQSSYHAPAERHLQMKMDPLGSWFESLTTSGWDPVRPEALEGRTGYLQSSNAEGLRGDNLR